MIRPIIEQAVIDAVATMAKRAVGDVLVELGDVGLNGDPATTAPNPDARPGPWVSIEWSNPPEPYGEQLTTDETDLPADALITLTALEGKYATVKVNGVRLSEKRSNGQSLNELRDVLIARLTPLVIGRLLVTAEASAIRVTPVVPGDLWRAEALAGAVVVLGELLARRVHQQIFRCTLLLTVMGGRVGSGAAGVAGDGTSANELATALSAELDNERTWAEFDAVPMRNVSSQATVWAPRRIGSRREGRLQTYLELGLTGRWCTDSQEAKVPAALHPPEDPDDPDLPPEQQPDTIDAGFQWVKPPLDPIPEG